MSSSWNLVARASWSSWRPLKNILRRCNINMNEPEQSVYLRVILSGCSSMSMVSMAGSQGWGFCRAMVLAALSLHNTSLKPVLASRLVSKKSGPFYCCFLCCWWGEWISWEKKKKKTHILGLEELLCVHSRSAWKEWVCLVFLCFVLFCKIC